MVNEDLQRRIDRALELRAQGYNCSQCVAMVFDDLTGTDASLLARITASLGGGLAAQREVCGAVTAMGIVEGLMTQGAPADKKAVYATVAGDCGEFREINGSIVCRELKKPGARPCSMLIADAVTILHNRLTAK